MMSTTELDPTILKALGYFRSNYADSTDKLKAMLTEAVDNSKRGYEGRSAPPFEKPTLASGRTVKISGNSSDLKKREISPIMLSKRPFDKLQEPSDFGIDLAKKRFYAGSSSSLIESNSSKVDLMSSNGAFGKSSPADAPPPSEDFVLEMAGLACTVCNEMTVGSNNRLVECQDCHSLYHQDCHQPPVTDKDMNDPRRVWYCAKCKQKMKHENSLLLSPVSRTSANAFDLSSDKTKIKPKPTITPFKRTELKPSLSSSSNSAPPLSGWAPLSGKSSLTNKSQEEFSRSTETSKPDNSFKKSSSQKEKTKSAKNHSKNLLQNSDAWAEALGAKSSNDKHKTSSKGASSSNNTKHATLSSPNARLSASGINTAHKQKSSFNSLASHKSAPFPKTSASSGSVTKSMSTHDSAANKMQLMKKKAAAKLQQKRARI